MRVLIVEDSPERIEAFRGLFRDHASVWATTAARASRLVEAFRFDLITLDFDLAGPGDGATVAAVVATSHNAEARVWVHSMNDPGAKRILTVLPHAARVPYQSLIRTNAVFKRLRDALGRGPDIPWPDVFRR